MRCKSRAIAAAAAATTMLLLLLTTMASFSQGFAPQLPSNRRAALDNTRVLSTLIDPPAKQSMNQGKDEDKLKVVLVAGFESFNRDLYNRAGDDGDIELVVFSDSDIRSAYASPNDATMGVNPDLVEAIASCDVFLGSLIFDYDDVLVMTRLLEEHNPSARLVFECATELMSFNKVGTFSMATKPGEEPAGPPPAVKAILSKFSSGKEEDKINGYLKLLKVGPTLLQYVPGEKASDLRTWLEAYRYWNQGGSKNVQSMFKLLARRFRNDADQPQVQVPISDLVVTPDVGLIHPLREKIKSSGSYFTSPAAYLNWRLSRLANEAARKYGYKLAPPDAPRVAVLLYRKHVITEQKYLQELITIMEAQGLLPIPIFINGVEAHTIVRDVLTSSHEIDGVLRGTIVRDSTYRPQDAVRVDAIVNTVGFPLVGGPAGSIETGRNVDVSAKLLSDMNVPYIVAGPLLLQSIPQWKQNGVLGLQSVALYSLPELDGAIDTVVLGGLVGDKIALVPERARKLTRRVQKWVELRRTPAKDRRIAVSIYGFPPNVGAVGTAALLNVPQSLHEFLLQLDAQGYDVGGYASNPDASGETLVAALSVLSEDAVIAGGADRMAEAVNAKIERARAGDSTVAASLASGLGDAEVRAVDMSMDDIEKSIGKYMAKKLRRSWPEGQGRNGPGVSSKGNFVVSGIQLGNVFLTVQPLLGIEGDPMRMLFDRDLTPHPQYLASYSYLQEHAQAMVHFGMHGTSEWLSGMPLGNDRQSWSDEVIGDLPNMYVYAANNPSESILAKRRGYATIVSHNVPPYGRAGLYLELANLKELIGEYREVNTSVKDDESENKDLLSVIWSTAEKSSILTDVPLLKDPSNPESVVMDVDAFDQVSKDVFDGWISSLSNYLFELQERLFSSGLHVLGGAPTNEELNSYLEAYFGDKLSSQECDAAIAEWRQQQAEDSEFSPLFSLEKFTSFVADLFGSNGKSEVDSVHAPLSPAAEAAQIVSLLGETTNEMGSLLNALDGGYVPAGAGGDLLRDGPSVLPTGRNIHALDPYRMPSAGAWARGQRIAEELIRQHREANNDRYPETIAVTLWGLDAIKTRGESVAISLALVGAEPIKEGTGRIVRFDLVPLEKLGRPRIDVLASLSGIFRDSFANVVDLLDDMFERAATANEPISQNFVKKHADELAAKGTERPAARLFSNPPGDYGSMVNEVVGVGDWEESESLGETWQSRNVFSYGRNEGGPANAGTSRPEVLDKLLETTERIVQEVDSVEYGLTDIQEYYANTGALKKAAENRKEIDPQTGKKKKVTLSVVEAFTSSDEASPIPVRDVDDVLRLEYRSKLLNPKWTQSMLLQGSGGAYEVSQRMTAMIGWAATSEVDNFVFDQAAERYALDEEVASQLQKSNPEAFKNVVRRLLEASGRGMWETDEETLDKLKNLYADADDLVEQGSSTGSMSIIS